MAPFPYEKYKKLKAWKVIEKELHELVENQDLQITTMPDLVIGSLVKCLEKHNLLKEHLKGSGKKKIEKITSPFLFD